jgi:hypothetical protein
MIAWRPRRRTAVATIALAGCALVAWVAVNVMGSMFPSGSWNFSGINNGGSSGGSACWLSCGSASGAQPGSVQATPDTWTPLPLPSFSPQPLLTPRPPMTFPPAPPPATSQPGSGWNWFNFGPFGGGPSTRGCTAADLALSVATDARAYASGATVHTTLSVSNRSSTTCMAPDDRCTHTAALARSATLQQDVWDSRKGFAGNGDCNSANSYPAWVELKPGAPHQVALPWSQRDCANPCTDTQVPPGDYQVRGLWQTGDKGEVDAAPVTIHIG